MAQKNIQEQRAAELLHVVTPAEVAYEGIEAQCAPETFSVCIRALQQNWRQGTVACKDRSKVTSRSNKKPWKQKGTGRARAGSPRSPLWRGGGVVFGPQPRVRTAKVGKSVKRQVMQALLKERLEGNQVLSLNWQPQQEAPKTALAFTSLRQAGLHDKKMILFVSWEDQFTQASFANIPNVRMMLFDQPNAYTLADSDCWVFLAKDADKFKEMVSLWI